MTSSSELPSFDVNEIDEKISKEGEYISGKESSNKAIFKFVPNISKENLENKDDNISFPKYFCEITAKDFKYIGILTNQLKRDLYGYSLMDNEDEFLGEYKNQIREGFGMYKFKSNEEKEEKEEKKEKEEKEEIYIGEYINNKKEGKGMYLKINKYVKDDSNDNIILIDFDCNIGTFKDNILQEGIIFSLKDNKETLYCGKLNELGEQEDTEAFYIEDKNKIFKGIITKGNMVEGRNIFINDKYEKIKAYYFIINKKENTEGYEFDNNKNEEKDNECIDKAKELLDINHKKKIQEIFNMVNNNFKEFKEYEKAINIDFENDIKNKVKSELDNIIMN